MYKSCNSKLGQIFLVLPILFAFTVTASPAYAKKNKDFYKNCNSKSTKHACNSSLKENTYSNDTNKSYDLVADGVSYGTNAANSNVTVNGVKISLAAFADTQNIHNEVVVGASLEKISDKWAYGVTNNDEAGYYGWSDHAIDNVNHYSQGSNNAYFSGMTNVERDYDFVLLSFDKAVTLTGAGFSWLANLDDSQVSVAALNNTSLLTSGTSTWSNIVDDALTTGSFDIKSSGNSDYEANFTFKDAANYWLVGAYNTVFGNIGGRVGNDAFKLAAVDFSVKEIAETSNTTEVSEPGTVGLLMACSLFAMLRRKTLFN